MNIFPSKPLPPPLHELFVKNIPFPPLTRGKKTWHCSGIHGLPMQLVFTQYTFSSLDPGDWYLNSTVHGVSQVPLNKKIHETNPNLVNEVVII